MILVAIITLVLCAQALAPARSHIFSGLGEERPGDDIEALCTGKPVNLTTFSQLKTLSETVSACWSCSNLLRQALPELATLIEHSKTDLCSADSIGQLQVYYTKYLDTSDKKNKKKHDELLPKSLRQFVLAYGLQTSNLCKRNMAKVLTEQSPELLGADDQRLLEQLTSDQGPVAQVLGVMSGGSPDEIFMPGDLAPMLKRRGIETKELGRDKLYIQTATGPFVKRVQSVCKHRYKPVYEPLMLPLVRLANMGFNYRDGPLKCYLDCPKVQVNVGRWSRIVFLCEALANIEIVGEPTAQEDQAMAQNGVEPVRILTKEEAAAMRRAAKEASGNEDLAKLTFEPSERVVLGELIYDRSNKILRKLVRKFKTNLSVDKIMRKRMASKGLALARDQLRQGQFGVVLSAAYKGLLRREKEITNPAELVVKSLDEMIQRNGTAIDESTKSKVGTYNWLEGAILDAFVFIICVAFTIALTSSFFIGLLL